MAFDASVHAKAIELTRLSVEMTAEANSGHPSSAASLAHLVAVLMYGHMRYNPADPANVAADRLVLSEGHACPIVYAAAADLGVAIGKDGRRRPMTRKDALRLREIDSELDGHPNPAEGFPFFPSATGSLGQGLSVAAGIALAARLDGSPKRVFCLIGDGESREGQIWEAVDFIVENTLTAVCPIFNCNGWGQADRVGSQQFPDVTAAKLRGAGFEVRIIDGHSPSEIWAALAEHTRVSQLPRSKPFAIVAKTVKGWGFQPDGAANIHGKPVIGADRNAALAQLDKTAAKLGATWTDGDLRVPPVTPMAPRPVALKPLPGLREALRSFGLAALPATGKMAPRRAYGIALRVLGHARPDVVALDGDVRNSTFAETFANDPALKERYFECHIAEQNMLSVAGGLAASGKTPFVSSFGKFITRAYDQFEMDMISRFNLKLTGSHAGANIAADGPSQMALADIAFFRSYATVRLPSGKPALHVLNPSDALSAYALTLAMARHEGACYMRTMRPDVELLYSDSAQFSLGGHGVLAEGRDLLIVASGYLVHEARKALSMLKVVGIEAALVDLYSLPFDQEAIARLAKAAGGRVLTVEDNYGASMGSAVADALTELGGTYTVKQMYVRQFPKSGRSPDDVLKYLGLTANDIVETARKMVS